MNELHVSLPPSLINYAQNQADERGFRDVSQFVEGLINADKATHEQLKGFVEAHSDRLETLLIEGLDSGDAGPMTADDWQRLKQPFLERIGDAHHS
jgi:antitoxin ParD1/3/4